MQRRTRVSTSDYERHLFEFWDQIKINLVAASQIQHLIGQQVEIATTKGPGVRKEVGTIVAIHESESGNGHVAVELDDQRLIGFYPLIVTPDYVEGPLGPLIKGRRRFTRLVP